MGGVGGSLEGCHLFFREVKLLFLFVPLVMLVLDVILPSEKFSRGRGHMLSSLPRLGNDRVTSNKFRGRFRACRGSRFPLHSL